MAYKNLLVHLDETEACKGRVTAAIAVAKAQEAYLTGFALAIEASVPAYIGGQLPVEVLEVQHAQMLERGRAAAALFDKALGAAGQQGESRVVSGLDIDAARVIALHARHADLVVLGQEEPEAATALPGRSRRA